MLHHHHCIECIYFAESNQINLPKGGCGVMIATKQDYDIQGIELEANISAEIVWATISLKDQRKLVVGVQKSTAYTWLDCCCFNAAQIVLTPPAPRNGGPFLPFFGQAGQVDPLVGWRSCY